jgi:hypothetical protein
VVNVQAAAGVVGCIALPNALVLERPRVVDELFLPAFPVVYATGVAGVLLVVTDSLLFSFLVVAEVASVAARAGITEVETA